MSPAAPAGPVLVAAKLHVPALRAAMVSRGELAGQLVGAGDCKLVLVCAQLAIATRADRRSRWAACAVRV